MVTSAKDWKGRANKAVELELPSGNTALVRNPGMQAFLQTGIVPNELMGTILKAIEKQEMPDLDEFTENPDRIQLIVALADNVTVYCVVEPAVAPVPAAGEARDEDTLYVDEVDMDDKMFIFQFAVGGTKDLEQFRAAQASGVESLSAGKAVARPAKRTSGAAAKRRR